MDDLNLKELFSRYEEWVIEEFGDDNGDIKEGQEVPSFEHWTSNICDCVCGWHED